MVHSLLILILLTVSVSAFYIASFLDLKSKEAKIKDHLNILENKFNCFRTFIFTLSGAKISTLSISDDYILTIENEVSQNHELIKNKFNGIRLLPLSLYPLAFLEKSQGSKRNYPEDLFYAYGVRSYLIVYIKKRWYFKHYYYFVYLGWDMEGEMSKEATINMIGVQAPMLSKLV